MYLDKDGSQSRRVQWLFTYTGKELLEAAKAKHQTFFLKEQEARRGMQDLLGKMGESVGSEKGKQLEREITQFGMIREQCLVWQHEFQRNPDKEYTLAMGDVIFFDLVLAFDPATGETLAH